MEGNEVLKKDFKNNGISYGPRINKTLVQECIKAESNEPFWENEPKVSCTYDLRNPAYEKELEFVRKQMGITSEEFHSVMETGLAQAKADQLRPVNEVFAELRRELQ